MKRRLPKGILTAAAIAARMICSGQVYSQHIPSFEERHAAVEAMRTNGVHYVTFPAVQYGNDKICIANESVTSGTNLSYTAWIVSTNALANQPRWDGISGEIPLSISKARALALSHVRKQFPEVQVWAVESISLRKAAPSLFPDVWCYEVIFASKQRAILLLDGTVVSPTIAQ